MEDDVWLEDNKASVKDAAVKGVAAGVNGKRPVVVGEVGAEDQGKY